MKACVLFMAAFAASALAAAVPGWGRSGTGLVFKRAESPDGSCGGANRYTCGTSSFKCCSQLGRCGDLEEHCGAGCQAEFGICRGSSATSKPVTATSKPAIPTTNPSATTTTTSRAPTTKGITIPRTKPGNIPYGTWVSECNSPGFVALTFDDGPHIFTPALLDLLKANGVIATFFMNGHNWGDEITTASKVALVQRMLREGHQIASHTWSHRDMSFLTESELVSEMTQLETAFLGSIGKFPTYMRPPSFSCGTPCMQMMGKLGYHVINTNLNTHDWQNADFDQIQISKDIFRKEINAADPAVDSYIPLAHDVHEATVHSLVQDMITAFKAKGFRATTVGWCLDDHISNWYRTKQ